MKYLKWPLIILGGLVLIYLLLCLLGPKNMNAERSTTIQSPPAQVFNLINNLEKWDLWSSWKDKDTTLVITYGDMIEGQGASCSWKGDAKTSGSGEMKINESIKNEKVAISMLFHDWESTSFSDFTIAKKDKNVDLSWSISDKEDLPFMFRGFLYLLGMKGEMTKDMELALANIKKISEERAGGLYNGYKINPTNLEDKHFVMNRQSVDFANISQFYSTNLGALFGKVQQSGAEMKGMPCGLFFKWDVANNKTDMAAAIPVENPLSIEGASSLTVPEGSALQIDYYGDL